VSVTEGKSVIELAVIATDKGHALDVLRHEAGASAAVFVGDDVTDERAFVRLAGPDVGIKVGAGPSAAGFRVSDPAAVATVLALLVEERRAWLYGESAPPIERLSMLASPSSVALVSPDARLVWLCHPAPDSAAVFAELVGGAGAGHFSVRPLRGGLPLGQRYVPGTMTVETRFSQVVVTDYLAHGLAGHRTDVVRVVSGSTSVVVSFAPRPEFGQVGVRLRRERNGLRVVGTGDPIVLFAPGVSWEISSDGMHETATATIELTAGEPVVLELRCGTTDLEPHAEDEPTRRGVAEGSWSSRGRGARATG
jgi:hypothetical protein